MLALPPGQTAGVLAFAGIGGAAGGVRGLAAKPRPQRRWPPNSSACPGRGWTVETVARQCLRRADAAFLGEGLGLGARRPGEKGARG